MTVAIYPDGERLMAITEDGFAEIWMTNAAWPYMAPHYVRPDCVMALHDKGDSHA